MAAYRLQSTGGVTREADGASIPNDPRNSDWQAYEAWVADGNTADPAPSPTLAQQALALLSAGCAIVSTGTPALDGTYPTDAASQQYVTSEVTSILLNGTFTDGATDLAWIDVSGTPHDFTIPEFKALATALAAFVTGCVKCTTGQADALPAQPVTIA
jgi:hypothetical protein